MFKNFINKVRVFSYYMGSSDVPRPILGMLLDFLLLIVIFFSACYIWLVYRTKSSILSLIVCLVVTSLFGFALYLRKRTTYKKNRQQKRKDISREYMINRLPKLSRQEFEWQLIKALSCFKELSGIEQRQGYLKGKYDNMPIAIGYHHSPPGGYESYERVWMFYKSLRSRGFRKFLYVSSGSFEESCQNIIDEELEESIYLLDSDDLLDLMELGGMLPNEDIIDHLVNQRIKKNRKKQKNRKNEVTAPSKLKRYMISSILFLGVSLVFPSYFLFYFVLSILFSILGLLSLILSRGENKYS